MSFLGAMSGGFNFQVNDGVNFTPRQIFSITAKALVVRLEKNRPLKVFPGKHRNWLHQNLCVTVIKQILSKDILRYN